MYTSRQIFPKLNCQSLKIELKWPFPRSLFCVIFAAFHIFSQPNKFVRGNYKIMRKMLHIKMKVTCSQPKNFEGPL